MCFCSDASLFGVASTSNLVFSVASVGDAIMSSWLAQIHDEVAQHRDSTRTSCRLSVGLIKCAQHDCRLRT